MGAFLLCGCGSLFERIPATDGSAASYKPKGEVIKAIENTGHLFGPWGDAAATLATLALVGTSHIMTRRGIRKAITTHAQDFHTVRPPRAEILSPPPQRDIASPELARGSAP